MAACKSLTDDLRSQADVSRAFGASKMRNMAFQVGAWSSDSGVCGVYRGRRVSRIRALLSPAEGAWREEIDWEEDKWR